MPTKAELISAVQAAQDEILRMAHSLTESERNATGTAEQWAPRDYLAHLGAGKRFWAEDLAAARRGETPPQGDLPERSNPAVYAVVAANSPPGRSSTAQGLFGAAGTLGFIVASLLAGALASVDILYPFYLMSAVTILTLLIAVAVGRDRLRFRPVPVAPPTPVLAAAAQPASEGP